MTGTPSCADLTWIAISVKVVKRIHVRIWFPGIKERRKRIDLFEDGAQILTGIVNANPQVAPNPIPILRRNWRDRSNTLRQNVSPNAPSFRFQVKNCDLVQLVSRVRHLHAGDAG